MVDLEVHKGPSSRAVKRKVCSSNSKPVKVQVQVSDPELLDCPICYAPFTIPIFQCENGHTACSVCCPNLANKCPSCALPIGIIRCRAIENVLQSVKLYCRNWEYGCVEIFGCGETYLEHEKTCESAPCVCPIPGCEYMASSDALYRHIYYGHKDCMIIFKYDHSFTVSFSNDDKFLVLGVACGSMFLSNVFLLNNNIVEQFGNVITVSRIAPTSSKERYPYDLVANIKGTRHSFYSYTENIPRKFEDKGPPSTGFHLDPVCAASDNGKIFLNICIWNQDSK